MKKGAESKEMFSCEGVKEKRNCTLKRR